MAHSSAFSRDLKLLSRVKGTRGCHHRLVPLSLCHTRDANPTRAGSLGRVRGSLRQPGVGGQVSRYVGISAFVSGSRLAPRAVLCSLQARGWLGCPRGGGRGLLIPSLRIFFLSQRVTGELPARRNVPACTQVCAYVPVSYL